VATDGEVRRPVVAGRFYAGDRAGLLREIQNCFRDELGPGHVPEVARDGLRRLVGLVCPHAGYMFSGPTAARGYARMAEDGAPATAVIIGPCHQLTTRAPAALQVSGSWQTPLGLAAIDAEAAEAVAAGWSGFALGPDLMWAEHSLEVQVPFLQFLYGLDLRIVPIMMVEQSTSVARAVGDAVGAALEGRDAVIVASTDLSHYLPPRTAQTYDEKLIACITAMDPDGLMALAESPSMSMCGYGAVAAMLHATARLGARSAEVLGYSNSGMVQPMAEVVGYVAVAVTR
jgi:hypothetical protein